MDITATKEKFLNLEYHRPDENEKFNGFVIIPTGELHESGYMRMKFALTLNGVVVGCVGGGCDVVNLNGIGGFGLNFDRGLHTRIIPIVDWSIECLPNGLLRVFASKALTIRDKYICSTFEIFAKEDKNNG